MGSATVLLGVDHIDPGRGDSEVVDVGAGARDPPIVEDPEVVGGQLVESLTQSFFPDGSDVPGLGRLRVLGEGVDESPDLRDARCGAVLLVGAYDARTHAEQMPRHPTSIGVSSRVPAAGVRLAGDRGRRSMSVGHAADRLRVAFVDRLGLGWQCSAADAAGPGVAKAHPLLV